MNRRSVNYEIGAVPFLGEEVFRRFLLVERKRSERSGDPWLLVFLDLGGLGQPLRGVDSVLIDSICSCLAATFRETDVIGWYQEPRAMGVIVTELGNGCSNGVLQLIREKLERGLESQLPGETVRQLNVSFYPFPNTRPEDLPDEIRLGLFPEGQTPSAPVNGTQVLGL